MGTSHSVAALRRISSESGENRVSRPAHASTRSRTTRTARSRRTAFMSSSAMTETVPPISGRLTSIVTGSAVAVTADRTAW